MEQDVIDPRTLGALLVNSAVIALAVIRDGRIVFVNPAFRATFQTTNKAPDALIGGLLTDVVVNGDRRRLADTLAAAGTAPARFFGTGWRYGDQLFDVELSMERIMLDGEPSTVAFAWDVSEQHRTREQLSFLAYTDPLTGLPNRASFADRLQEAIRFARANGTMFAVLMLDLDGFKAVNDTYGHDVGDIALQIAGQRFQGCVRDGDTLARIGGDEFAVLLPRVADLKAAALVAQRLIGALATPLDFGMTPVVIGTSVGIATWPEHAATVDALLAAADTAMYSAKRGGRNRFDWAIRGTGTDVPSLPPLTWGAAHAVGIQEIDDQHVHLAELINRLSAAMRDGLESDAILTDLSELIACTVLHFATEERLMEQHEVEGRALHREEHRRLLQDIRNLRVDDEVASVSLILRYLQEWLQRHVDGLDKELGRQLAALGCR